MKSNKITDKERLDWLETLQGTGLINDDYGRWAIPECGVQNVTDEKGNMITTKPIKVSSTFFVEAREWKSSARKAIDLAMKKEMKEKRKKNK